MVQMISSIKDTLLDLLFPLTCLVCHREGGLLCDGCEPALTRLEPPFCEVCADPGSSPFCSWCAAKRPPIDVVRAPYMMVGPLKEMVYGLKYRGVRAAVPVMGRLLAGYLGSHPLPADVLVPVPLHHRRERDRGYNQSELLAREVAKLSGLPDDRGLLRRTQNSRPQVSTATISERRGNVEGVFECVAEVGGGRVLLIDDVATTGATVSACAGALKDAGASYVAALVLARQA